MTSEITVNEYSTDFTTFSDKVVMVEDTNGTKALFRTVDSRKYLSNVDQMNHIINYLVIQCGFLMDKCSKDEIIFTHPQSNATYSVTYHYFPDNMLMVKDEHRFISELE